MVKRPVRINPLRNAQSNAPRRLASEKGWMGRPVPVITGMGKTLRDLENTNSRKIDDLSQGVLNQGKMISDEILRQNAQTSMKIDSVRQEGMAACEQIAMGLSDHVQARNPHGITKSTVGLDRVDNTSDMEKPVSYLTQIELNKKADKKALEEIESKIDENIKEQATLRRDVSELGWIGGSGGNELPIGGKTGQILAKKSDLTGDYEWVNDKHTTIHNDLNGRDVSDCHPISSITGLQTALDNKYDSSNPSGYISGITGTMVNEALGYTPYDSANPSNYQTGTEVTNSIAVETSNRESADNGLQSQIDAITASSDVKDIVGTYAQLQAYDTSTLGNNDIIRVLQDETQNDETTYYRWSTTTETFTLIGEEGPYYTKSAADSTFVPQTRTINSKPLSSNITLDSSDVNALPDSTKYGADLSLTSGTLQLLDQDGNALGNSVTVPDDSNLANKDLSNLASSGQDLVFKAGMLMPFAGSTAPSGWLICDGSAVSRTTYSDLFSVIGTTYGTGDGSTTFNLPNFVNKTFWGGSTSGTEKSAGLPDIGGEISLPKQKGSNYDMTHRSGVFTNGGRGGNSDSIFKASTSVDYYTKLVFKASSANSIYGNSGTVQPPAIQTLIIIKY